jgi:hypothetical protein
MSYSMTITVDNGGVAGHMYVGLTKNGVTTEYGYNPVTGKGLVPTLEGDGQVLNNETSTRNAPTIKSVEIPLTQQEYDNASNYATSVQALPGHYSGQGEQTGSGRNCVDFVNEVMDAAGVGIGVGNALADSELAISKAGQYADMRYGDASLLGLIADAINGINDAFNAAGSAISDAITEMMNALYSAFSTPIVLDLNNNGIEYIKNDSLSSVFFDIDADGFAEKTEWIKPSDGFLVRDLNGNGRIDSQAEMFGDNAGTSAYAKLAALNSNNTGASANALTSADTAWNTLRVWQDANSNGKTDAGELKTLSSLSITSVGLQSSTTTSLAGHKVAGTSTFIKNGVTQKADNDNYQNTKFFLIKAI